MTIDHFGEKKGRAEKTDMAPAAPLNGNNVVDVPHLR